MKERLKQWIQELELTPKEKYRIWLILLVSIVVAVGMFLWDNATFAGVLWRNTYGEGSKSEELLVSVEGTLEQERVIIEVQEQQYTSEEIDEIFTWCLSQLDQVVLGENDSFDYVNHNLNLPSRIETYPVELEWSWSPYGVLDSDGVLQVDGMGEDGTFVQLVGTLSYGELQVQYVRDLYCVPPTLSEAEQLIEAIGSQVEAVNQESISEEAFVLPDQVEDMIIKWDRETSYRGGLVLMMGCLCSVLLLWKKKQDAQVQMGERKEQMIQDYAEIVHLFVLYIGAGLTVKNAWIRIVKNYEERGIERYAYEEMKHTAVEMKNGVSEIESYERFGQNCDVRCYRRFALLIVQNVRKGTKGIVSALEVEAAEAFQEQKNRMKQKAEKAGTKLLMPMILMLGVVLTIIVVPAFISIQI